MKNGKWFEDKSKMVLKNIFHTGTLIHSEKKISTTWLSKGEGLYGVLKGQFVSISKHVSFGPISIEKIVEQGQEVIGAEKIDEVAFESYLSHVIV